MTAIADDQKMVRMREARAARAREYAAHVSELAGDLDVVIRHRSYSGGIACRSSRTIWVGEVKGIVSYYVALHELGHVVGRGRSAPHLEAEANAWLWAIQSARWAPTPSVRRSIAGCLRSYHERHRRMARSRYLRFPPAGHDFWRLSGLQPPSPRYDGRPVKL